jgi:hypothetical protein
MKYNAEWYLPGLGEGKNGEQLLNVSLWVDENVLKLDRGSGLHNSVNIVIAAELFSL